MDKFAVHDDEDQRAMRPDTRYPSRPAGASRQDPSNKVVPTAPTDGSRKRASTGLTSSTATPQHTSVPQDSTPGSGRSAAAARNGVVEVQQQQPRVSAAEATGGHPGQFSSSGHSHDGRYSQPHFGAYGQPGATQGRGAGQHRVPGPPGGGPPRGMVFSNAHSTIHSPVLVCYLNKVRCPSQCVE